MQKIKDFLKTKTGKIILFILVIILAIILSDLGFDYKWERIGE